MLEGIDHSVCMVSILYHNFEESSQYDDGCLVKTCERSCQEQFTIS